MAAVYLGMTLALGATDSGTNKESYGENFRFKER